MKAYELFMRLQRELPEANYRDYIDVLNDTLEDLFCRCDWNHSKSERKYLFFTLSVDGASLATCADDVFIDEHEGQIITVDGTEYTITTVNSATEAQLSAGGPYTNVEASIVWDWMTPTNLRRINRFYYEDGERELRDPRHYRLGLVSSDRSREIQFNSNTDIEETVVLEYWRRPTRVTAMESDIDAPLELEQCVYLGVLGAVMSRIIPLDPYTMRLRDVRNRFLNEINYAKSVNNTQRKQQLRNERNFFRFE